MRKVLFLFSFTSVLLFFSIFLLTGCTSNLTKEQEYSLDGQNISFTLSNIWEKKLSTTHDLSLTKLDSNLQFSVYKKAEVEMSPEKLLKEKAEAELSGQDNYSVYKKYNVNKTRNRTIYSRLYKATKDNVESEYLFSVIEFDNSDTYVFVVYNARGAYMRYSIDDIQRLLIKMEWNGQKTELAYN